MQSGPSENARLLWQRMRRASNNSAGGMVARTPAVSASRTPTQRRQGVTSLQATAGVCAIRPPAPPLTPEDANFLACSDAGVVAQHDDAYPPLLAETRDAPPLLFTCGDAALLARPQIAIVGSRNASPAGLANARRFAAELAAAGFVITSGMALGIDAMAHEGALAAGGHTVAVLGCGADVIYPRRHAALAARIRAQGCVVSEYLPGTPPLAALFPQRNRIISGLSLGVLVVEATPDSGSLITARFAAEQGREVFAIPGSIHAPTAQGCHQLIREGATLVERSCELVEALMHFAAPVRQHALPLTERAPPVLPTDEAALLALMSPAGSRTEELIAASGLPAGLASALLSSLAMRGLATALPGGLWLPATPG
jgi:DNA processing protein